MSEHVIDNVLADSLAAIGKDRNLREQSIEFYKKIEKKLSKPDFNVREAITGPIIDALHRDCNTLSLELKSGLLFDFHYRSKIAREIVMREEKHPDHIWEPQTSKLLVLLSDNVNHVVIGGAYSGDHAVLIANQLKQNSSGVCHCFEPDPDQLSMLKHNADINQLDNIISHNIGLWSDSNTRLKLVGFDSFAHSEVVSIIQEDDAEDSFPTTSINDYGKDNNIESIGLIMLDIEGSELPALQGASHYLSQDEKEAPSVVFEVHRHYVDWSNGLENTEIVSYLSELGYTVYALRDYNSNVPMAGHPIEIIPVNQVYLDGPPHGFNMLAIKNMQLIENEHFTVCHNVSPKLLSHRDKKLHQPLS